MCFLLILVLSVFAWWVVCSRFHTFPVKTHVSVGLNSMASSPHNRHAGLCYQLSSKATSLVNFNTGNVAGLRDRSARFYITTVNNVQHLSQDILISALFIHPVLSTFKPCHCALRFLNKQLNSILHTVLKSFVLLCVKWGSSCHACTVFVTF